MNNKLKWLTAVALSLFAVQGFAQHSDITFHVDDDQLVIGEDHHEEPDGDMDDDDHDHGEGLMTSDGKWLFETTFPLVLGMQSYATDDPGFVTEDGPLEEGDVLGFEATGSLQYWDTFTWTMATDATFTVTGGLFNAITDITGAGVVAGGTGYIDMAGTDGNIHQHIDFAINEEAPIGAYLIELMLTGFESDGTTQKYASSESFFIAFNLGLGTEDFEAGIDALVGPEVPVPAAAVLMFSALSALGIVGARKRKQA